MKISMAAGIGLLSLLLVGAAHGAELRVLSAIALQPVLDDLAPKFERATGHKVSLTFATLGAAVKRVHDGETFDVVIIPRSGTDGFVQEGKASAGDVAIVARSGMGVAVRSGAPRPELTTPEDFKRMLLAARAVTYSDPAHGGVGGIHVARLLDRLGIAAEMKPKTVFLQQAGRIGTLVAGGQADVAIGQIQELVAVPGIEIVGPLPAELQNTVVFSAAVMARAKEIEAGKALINFLRAPDAAVVIKAKGMDPAAP
jgi:molybdate transport system substrate-binding protein